MCLVLIDEICRGTETAKGTCIAGSIAERLDYVGCLGIVSTHLHGIFYLPLSLKNVDFKAMGAEVVNGCIQPTWRLTDGICRESLAYQTARKEGMPDLMVKTAEELYLTMSRSSRQTSRTVHHVPCIAKSKINGLVDRPDGVGNGLGLPSGAFCTAAKGCQKHCYALCKDKLLDLYNKRSISEPVEVDCVTVCAREQQPPSTVGRSNISISLSDATTSSMLDRYQTPDKKSGEFIVEQDNASDGHWFGLEMQNSGEEEDDVGDCCNYTIGC